MLTRMSTARSPIALDIGARRIKAAQLTRSGRAWLPSISLSVPRARPEMPLDTAEATALAHTLTRGGCFGRRVVLVTPFEVICHSVLDLPPRGSGAPTPRLAASEMQRIHRLDPGAFETSWWEVPPPERAGDGMKVMAEACAHGTLEPILTALIDAGLEVEHVVSPTSALTYGMRSAGGAEAVHAVMDLGWTAARLVILYRGCAVYRRSLPDCSLRGLHESVATGLKIDPPYSATLLGLSESEAQRVLGESGPVRETVRAAFVGYAERLADSLAAAITYAAHQYPAAARGRIRLIGGGADYPIVRDALGAAMLERTGKLSAEEIDMPADDTAARGASVVAGALEIWRG